MTKKMVQGSVVRVRVTAVTVTVGFSDSFGNPRFILQYCRVSHGK